MVKIVPKKLNLEIGKKVSEFEALMHNFEIKTILYQSMFRGKGLEFDGYRDFGPDDDVARIDWKATKRSGRELVKKFIEERDLKIIFVIDVSENMVFGSSKKLKCEYAAELVAALAHLILTAGDKVGFVLYNEKVVRLFLPEGGLLRFTLLINELADSSYYGGGSDLKYVLDYLFEYLKEDISAVFIISDFIRINKGIFNALNNMAQKFEVMALIVRDPLDRTMPSFGGELVLEDPVTSEQIVINPKVIKKSYEKHAKDQEKAVISLFERAGVDFLSMSTDRQFAPDLASFLRGRIEEKRYIK